MDILLNILKDKKTLIEFLVKTIQETEQEKQGLMRLSDSLTREEPNLSPANIAKCLAVTMKVSAKQSNAIQNLAVIALIQAQSNSFDVDVAQMMNKLGRGQEALQQMFKNKMEGK